MGLLASLFVRIGAQTQEYDRAITRSSNQLKSFARDVSDAGRRLTLGLSLPLAGAAAAALKAAGDMEALEKGLTVVAGSTEAARKQLTQLKEVAKLPGLGLQEAVRGAINLQAVGFSAEKSQRILLQFGNALASVGRGREDLDEVIRQLGQMASRGQVTADNLKPILERVPQVAQIIRKEFGTIDTEVLQKMGVSAEQMTEVLLRELGKLPRVAGGINNDFENLRDSVFTMAAELGKMLIPAAKKTIDVFVSMTDWVIKLKNWFSELNPMVQKLGLFLGGIAIGAPPVVWGITQIVGALGSVGGALARMTPFLMNPYVLAFLGIGAAIGGTVYMVRSLSETNAKLDEAFDKLARGKQAVNEWSGEWTAAAGKLEGAGITVTKIDSSVQKQTEAMEAAAPAIEQVRLKAMGLAETLREIEASRAAAKLEAEWSDIFAGAEAHRRGEVPGLPEAPQIIKDTQEIAREVKKAGEKYDEVFGRQAPVAIEKTAKKTKETLTAFDREVRRTMDHLARTMAGAIVNAQSLGDAFKGIAKSIMESILEYAIKRGIAQLILSLDGVIGKLGALGKALLGWAGGMAGAAGSAGASAAGSAAGQAAGGAASAGAGVASGVVGGVTGILGAVGSIGSMVSGIVGNFQMAGMNKSLDLIEKATRYSEGYLLAILEKLNLYIPELANIRAFLWDPMLTVMLNNQAALAGGGGQVVFQNCTFTGVTQDLVEDIFSKAEAAARNRTGNRN